MRKVLSKVQKVKAISASQKKFAALLERAEGLANKIYKAFDNPATKFSTEEVKKVCANLETVANHIAKQTKQSFVNLRVAIATELPTTRIVAHVEDAHTLLSKIAILKAQAIASIAADDDIQMDESGQLVEETPMEDAGDEMLDEEVSEEEKTPEELQQDIHTDLDLLVQELSGEVPAEEEAPEMGEEIEASKTAKTVAAKPAAAKEKKAPADEVNPNLPKENPKADEPKDVLKLQDQYEKAPTNKNAKKKSDDKKADDEVVAEDNPDMPKENPEMTEESLEELVDDYTKSPSDPENLEMEDSMIDDAVNLEILSEGDSETLEDEVVKASTATLRDKKLATAKKSSGNTPATEEDVLSNLISDSMF
ncbi:MAG: hypothetical protein WC511_02640 [Candidatus Pacearchaeota archaeon]